LYLGICLLKETHFGFASSHLLDRTISMFVLSDDGSFFIAFYKRSCERPEFEYKYCQIVVCSADVFIGIRHVLHLHVPLCKYIYIYTFTSIFPKKWLNVGKYVNIHGTCGHVHIVTQVVANAMDRGLRVLCDFVELGWGGVGWGAISFLSLCP